MISAVVASAETHGQYLDAGKVARPAPLVESDEGAELQKKIWRESMEKFEAIQQGANCL